MVAAAEENVMFYNTDSDLVRNNMILLWRVSGCWVEVGGGCSSYASLGSAGPQAAASSWGTQGLGPQQHSRQQHNNRATTSQQQGHNTTTSQHHNITTPPQLYPALASLRRAAVIRVTHVAARRPEIRVLLFCGSGDCD